MSPPHMGEQLTIKAQPFTELANYNFLTIYNMYPPRGSDMLKDMGNQVNN